MQLLGEIDESGQNGEGQLSLDGWYGRSSVCMGNESNIAQCYRHEIAKKGFPPIAATLPCDQQIVAACSAATHHEGESEEEEEGVWVVGDDTKHHPESASKPTIVTETGYREDCQLGGVQMLACWGQVLALTT